MTDVVLLRQNFISLKLPLNFSISLFYKFPQIFNEFDITDNIKRLNNLKFTF